MSGHGAGGRGLFVVLDGVDGCGKSTQAELLTHALSTGEPPYALHVREPGTTRLGEGLRALLLDREIALDPGTEALLFTAARRHLLATTVEPAILAGRDVVCERFHASTFAYQGVAGELGEEAVLALLDGFAGRPTPDLEVVLDLDPQVAAERRGSDRDRIEDKGLEFQRRVAAGYRLYAELRERAVLVDASGSPERVHERVLAAVRERSSSGALR